MGKFYRGGRLVSAETLTISGERTLGGSTEEHLWLGTATTRPTPGGIQLRVVSSSTEDDSVKTQSGTITIAGTMDPVVTDVWTVTAGGNVDAGDIARIVFDGTNYDALIQSETTTSHVATTMATQLNSGTKDTYNYNIGGTLDVGDIITLTLNGTPYTYEITGGETANDVAAQLAAAAAADPNYDVTNPFGSSVLVQRKVRGVNAGSVSCVWTTDPGLDATCTEQHAVTGVAAITGYTATTSTADVIITQDTPGAAGVVTVSSSYATDPGVDSTLVTVHTTTGADADILSVRDGGVTFAHTVASAVLADEVAALAALIDAHAAYVASSALGVITVSAAVPGVAFTFTDLSTDNQTADLSVTIDNTANMANGAGTGIQTLRLDYLDANGVLQNETVTMDGTTAVLTTATDIKDVLGVSALTVGSNGKAVGTVTVTNTAGSTQYDVITVGSCSSRSAAYTVPASRSLFIDSMHAAASTSATIVRVYSNANPATGAIVSGGSFPWHTTIVGSNSGSIQSVPPIGPLPAGAKVWCTAKDATNTLVAVEAQGYLEPA